MNSMTALAKLRDQFHTTRYTEDFRVDANLMAAALKEIDAALSAPKAEAVTVKPLEWIGDHVASAETPFGTYTVAENIKDRWEWTFHKYPCGSPDETAYETEDKAKAAAQADYEARILSAIDTSPVPALTDEAVERALAVWFVSDNLLDTEHPETIAVMREAMRASLLAAFPSKGEGE